MNQEIEQAIIDQTNKVWDAAWKVGKAHERDRIIGLLNGLFETRPMDWEDPYRGYSIERLIEIIKGE